MENFAKIVRSLYKLTRKEQKWEWEIMQEKSFKALKKRFMMKPILVVPDLDKRMRLEVNASDYAIVRVLSMECDNR